MNLTNFYSLKFRHLLCLLVCACYFLIPQTASAAAKVFTAVVNEDVELERLYEVRDISFTITSADSGDTMFVDGTIKGQVGLDAISGRMIVELSQLSKTGLAMTVAGYVEANDNQKGIPACTSWQTRMFEEEKLCYAGKISKGTQVKVILSPDK